jgi:hypothetical protein
MAPRSPGRFLWDFVVYDSHGQLVVLVEAKRRFGTTLAWAREWHEIVMEQTDRPINATVVLVVPDRAYVWRPGADKSAPPDSSFEAGPWFEPYFTRLKIPARQVAPHVFEQIVGLWLRDVIEGEEQPRSDTQERASALFSGLRGGEVVEQMAA